jgi:hypothetical protein
VCHLYGDVRVLQSTDERLPDAVHQEAARADLPSSDLDKSVAENSGGK